MYILLPETITPCGASALQVNRVQVLVRSSWASITVGTTRNSAGTVLRFTITIRRCCMAGVMFFTAQTEWKSKVLRQFSHNFARGNESAESFLRI